MERVECIVVGDGWAALLASGYLAQAGKSVAWIANSGARALPPLSVLEAGDGARAWQELLQRLSGNSAELQEGSFVREFRNKAFRETSWARGDSVEDRRDKRDSLLWAPETRFAPLTEARFELPLCEIEEQLRAAVLALPNLRRMEGVPVTGFRTEAGEPVVIFGSGEEICAQHLFVADKWTLLGGIEGLPKSIPFARNREPMSILQAVLTHKQPIVQGLQECFFGVCHKDAGEEIQRNIWGYFFDSGRKSVWSLFLGFDEAEDNHEITKKLRKTKQALDRMFVGPEWLGANAAEFMATVKDEQVRFEESWVFGAGKEPVEVLRLPKIPHTVFLTDGYGPASAGEQVLRALTEELGAADSAFALL
jgi:hypothetical protein